MIKLVASDLDGTLLQGGVQNPTPYAIELIHKLTQKGVHFVAASGRQYHNERRMFDEIKDEISYIAENGSICIHKGEVISRSTISDDLTARIIAEVKKQAHFEMMLSREDACFVENNNPIFVNHISNVMRNTSQVVDDLSKVKGPVLKLAVCGMSDNTHEVDEYLRHLQDMFGNEIKIVTSGSTWIDFLAPGANKGTALQSLIDVLRIKPEECMAFGDQYNDVEMLQLVGTSYAMSNAAPGISYYSTYVTKSVEEVLEDLLAEVE
ncbi:MAG: HAD family hydrolase [Muricomes sp.]